MVVRCLGWVELDLCRDDISDVNSGFVIFPLLAATLATYCLSRMAERHQSQSTQPR